MKNQFKNQFGIGIASFVIISVFLFSAPLLTHADSLPAPSYNPYDSSSLSTPANPSTQTTAPSSSGSSLSQINDFNGLATRIASIGTVIVYILTGLAVVYIVWSIVQYFIKGKEGESRGPAGLQILWGIIGLAIILSLWGLVNILLQTFGTNTTAPTSKLPNANFITNSSGSGSTL